MLDSFKPIQPFHRAPPSYSPDAICFVQSVAEMMFIKTKHCWNYFVSVISSDCFHTLVNGQQGTSLDFLYLELSN